MPELPEVETIAQILRHTIVGKRIVGVDLSGLPLRKPVEDSFAAKLRGRTIRTVGRIGKYLIVGMEPESLWLVHLGMSGKLLVSRDLDASAKHTHAIIHFSDDTRLEYRDPRRFGFLAVYEGMQLSQIPEISSLGKDPTGPGFDENWLYRLLQKSRCPIKNFLLDQHNIAGLGNIYACESLFYARIHPARRCFTLSMDDTRRLVRAIRKVLHQAIRNGGTSFSDFMDSEGKPGRNQKYLSVFQKEGHRCTRCHGFIRKMRQGNRSTFYCARCQK